MGTGFFLHHRIVSAFKGVEFVSDRMAYTVVRGHCSNIFVVNVHAPSDEKSDDPNDDLYEELEQLFSHPPKYHMTIQLEELTPKFGRQDIFTPKVWSDSLH